MAFGLAGVNLQTWTGWGSVPHYHAFFGLGLSAPEITDLVAYLQAL